MVTRYSERISELRTKQKSLLRQLSSKLVVVTSIIGKIERSDHQLKKEQILLLTEIINVVKKELLILWLINKLNDIIKVKPLGKKAIYIIIKTGKSNGQLIQYHPNQVPRNFFL